MRNMKKKILIASFFAALMLMMPFTAAAQQNKVVEGLSETLKGYDSGYGGDDELETGMMQLTQDQLDQLYAAVAKIEDDQFRMDIQAIVDEIISDERQLYGLDLDQVLSAISRQIPLAPDEEIDDIFDLLIWLMQVIIDMIGQGIEDIIYQVYYLIINTFATINDLIDDVGDIIGGVIDLLELDDAPLLQLLYAVFAFSSYLIGFVHICTNLPGMIADGIEAAVMSTIGAVFIEIAEFLEPRLGYVADPIPYMCDILSQYENIKAGIDTAVEAFRLIFIELPQALLNFTYATRPIDRGVKLVQLIQAAGNALGAALGWIQEVIQNGPPIVNALRLLISDLQWLVDYLEAEPWLEPIHIQGWIENANGPTTVSCDGDEYVMQGGNGYFSIYYSTVDADPERPYKLHLPVVTVEDSDTTETYTRPAFSNGEISLYIDFNEDDNIVVNKVTSANVAMNSMTTQS